MGDRTVSSQVIDFVSGEWRSGRWAAWSGV